MDKKINIIGKIGRIVTTILIVVMILGAVATAAGIGVTASLPEDALGVTVSGTADITAKGKVLESITNAISDAAKGGKGVIKLGDSNLAIGDVEDSVPEGVTVAPTDKGITMSMENQRMDLNVKSVMIALIFTLLNTICTIVVLFMVRALMKSIEKCETPFCDPVIRNMRRFGFSLIPFAVFSGTSENTWQSLFTVGVETHSGINLTVVFGILIVFMLVMIFSYGAELQKQSDETL